MIHGPRFGLGSLVEGVAFFNFLALAISFQLLDFILFDREEPLHRGSKLLERRRVGITLRIGHKSSVVLRRALTLPLPLDTATLHKGCSRASFAEIAYCRER